MLKFEENLASRVSGALQPMLGVQVTVTASNGLLATLYADDESTVLGNPLETDTNGYFGFKAANGEYTLTFAGAQIETAVRKVQLYDEDDDPPLTLAQAAVPTAASRFGFQSDSQGSVPRTIENKLNETVSAMDFGAVGDGVTNDRPAVLALLGADGRGKAELNAGTYNLTAVNFTPNKPFSLKGAGAHLSKLQRDPATGSFFYVVGSYGALYEDFSIDNRYGETGQAGHGLVLQNCDNQRVRGVNVYGVGNSDMVSPGSAVLALPTLTSGNVRNIVLQDMHLVAGAGNANTVGTLIVDGRYCRQSGIFAEGFTHFATEYKEDTRYSLASDIIAYNSAIALGYGQSTEGIDGCDFNAAVNIVSHECTQAITVGEGEGNIFSNIVAKADTTVNAYGVDHSSDSKATLVTGLLTHGAGIKYPVRYRGTATNCFTSVAAHDTASRIVTLDVGSSRNVTEVLHPGSRNSIRTLLEDVSGNGISGPAGNVTFCAATGEYIGSLSGVFFWKLGASGLVTYPVQQKWQYESDGHAVFGLSSPGAAADTAGVQVNKGTATNFAGLTYVFGSDYWSMRVNSTNVGRFAVNLWRPENDGSTLLGAASSRFSTIYASTGTINTSDEREKFGIQDIDAAAVRAVRRIPFKQFKFADAVQAKGDNARWHFGVIAQQVKQAFETEGLDAFAYGVLCYDEWPEQPEVRDETTGEIVEAHRPAGSRYGVRYEELLCLKLAAMEAA